MRITENQVVSNMQNLIDNDYSQLSNLEEVASTGLQLQKPSDSPQTIGIDMQVRATQADLTQYKSNIQDGIGYTGATDTALSGMNTLLQSMRELAVEGSSDTLSSVNRSTYNAEVQQLTEQLISLVNTQYKGSYVFGGTQTETPPVTRQSSSCATATDYASRSMAYYNAAGAAVPATVQLQNGVDGSAITNIIPGTFSLSVGGTTYQENTDYTVNYTNGTITLLNPALAANVSPGTANYASGQFAISFSYVSKATVSNTGVVQRTIAPGTSTPINISADEVIQDPANGSDMFATAIALGQNMLQNNVTGVGAAIDQIDAVATSVQAAEAKNGARADLLQNALTGNEQLTTGATEQQTNLEDADMSTAITNYTNAQNVYQAALQSTAMITQKSLMDFLSI